MTLARDPRSDEELVRVCNEGDAPAATLAFELLYRRHRDYVLRVAMRFCGDRDMARDALQETFLYLLGKLPPAGDGLRLTARMTTLLYPVAKNSAISAVRRAERLAGSVSPDDLPDAGDQGHGDNIDAALAGLSAKRREVLLLRFVDDMTLDEIASALTIPTGTVKSRIHLAIRDLRADPDVKKFFDP